MLFMPGEENDILLIAPKFFEPVVIERYEEYNLRESGDGREGCEDSEGD